MIITIGVYSAQRSINRRDSLLSPESTNPSPEASGASSHIINITSPNNYTIATEDDIKITGITTPTSMIVSLNNDENAFSNADEQGIFTLTTDLEAGENIIRVISYDPSGNDAEAEVIIIYSTADLNSQTNADEETDEE